MAAKLILSMDGMVIKEYPLNKGRMTIGRKAHNDIVIDNLAVSGEHAAVVTILNDSFLEDLDSTNGLEVNGTATKKHFLQHNDLIEIGKYKLKYINELAGQANAGGAADFEKTMVLRAPAHQGGAVVDKANETASLTKAQAVADAKVPEKAAYNASKVDPQSPMPPVAPVVKPAVQVAAVQILTGPNAGRELELVKNLTTLGKPGVQVAVLTRRPHGFFITHVEGANYPSVNGQVLGCQPHQLSDHDVIELAGVKMEFYFKG